jgi:hypothetical protein
MPKRQGRHDFGLNLQTRKADSMEIQTDFYVVILIETAVNGAVFGDFAIRRDDNLARDSCFELRSAAAELDLRYSAIVVLVEFGNLRRVLDCQRQCCLQPVRALSDREAT